MLAGLPKTALRRIERFLCGTDDYNIGLTFFDKKKPKGQIANSLKILLIPIIENQNVFPLAVVIK